MLKALSGPAATYQPSKRSTHWLKIKRCACLPRLRPSHLRPLNEPLKPGRARM